MAKFISQCPFFHGLGQRVLGIPFVSLCKEKNIDKFSGVVIRLCTGQQFLKLFYVTKNEVKVVLGN